MKVAINTCYGGFSISEKAFELLLTRKGVAFEKRSSGSDLLGNYYYNAGHLGDAEHFISDYSFYNDRSDPDLIAVIEELGKEAEGWAANISVVDIPDDVKWYIHEFDGIEHVAEIHRTWYGGN